jgi:hypothetical protein
VKKLPWASLLLLLFTYGLFGWFIAAGERKLTHELLSDISLLMWLMGAAYTLLIALALTAPFTLMRKFYSSWLKSDTRAFLSIIVGAFVAVVIINWLPVFIRILVLIAAVALVRLELQTAGYSKWQAFGILFGVSQIGFCLGVIANQLI